MTSQAKIKQLNTIAIIISVAIPIVVAILTTPNLLPKLPLPFDPYMLPPFYAAVNALTATVLGVALWAIKRKKIVEHQRMINLAMGLSLVFLLCYVVYHASAPHEIRFGDTNHDFELSDNEKQSAGFLRYVYYFFLSSHIILSIVIVPFVLFTYIRGFSRQDERHRKLAKITFPLWMYVAVTGVICFLMLLPYMPE